MIWTILIPGLIIFVLFFILFIIGWLKLNSELREQEEKSHNI